MTHTSDLLILEENVKVRFILVHKRWIHFAEHNMDKYVIHFLVGCEKDVLIEILTQRCNSQRLMIAEAYRDMYGRDLITDLKENLSHHFKEVMVGLMYPPASYDAHELWHALKGVDTEEKCLIDILASRSNMEIFQMKEAYLMQYNTDLQQDIDSETSGHFRDTLMNLAQGTRMEGYADPSTAAQDAMDFGFHNKTVIRILIARSEIDLMNIRQRYKERYGKSLFHDIKHFASGHYESALLAVCAGDAEDY
ncbi:hypothetical protein DUI87_08912 [Hirundo rustica rustica]|uniref:Annexin n=1 Tax=Hirundo rustica rustica TaxID=333673 RepID=A0A3M0KKP7_HIRRU|nr:hypothetical protein DUI87_08912 [Hirundo rustica rustica]